MANLSKTLHTNFYQNRSTFVEVMHISISVCFYAPQCISSIPSNSALPICTKILSKFVHNFFSYVVKNGQTENISCSAQVWSLTMLTDVPSCTATQLVTTNVNSPLCSVQCVHTHSDYPPNKRRIFAIVNLSSYCTSHAHLLSQPRVLFVRFCRLLSFT